jgi:hypothetical protein
VVVGCRDEEIAWGWGFGPAKPKTERNVLGIGLVLKWIAWVIVGTYWIRGKGWWWWWDAGSERSRGGGGFALPNRKPSVTVSIFISHV